MNYDINNVAELFNYYRNTNNFSLLYQMLMATVTTSIILKYPIILIMQVMGVAMHHVIYCIATAVASSVLIPTQ